MSKRCKCGVKKDVFCSNCSKYRMVMCLKNGCDHLKETTKQGQLVNPVWYSILSKDHQPENRIFTSMLRRFSTSKYAGHTNIIQFRDNQTNNLLTEYKTL